MGTTTIAQKAPQLVLTDLVHQLEPPIEGHVQPDLDNTVKSLFYWAMDLVIPIGPRMVLLTILRHIDWTEGDGCRASIPTLARESQFSSKTLKGHLKYLLDQKIIMRQRRMNKASETRLAKQLHQPVGEAATPTSGRSGYTSNQSSSSNPFSNQSLVALDPKMDDLLETEPVEVKPEEPEPVSLQERAMVDEVNDGGTNKFSNLEEEGATEPEPELQPLDKVNDGERERERDEGIYGFRRRNEGYDGG